MVSGKCSRYLSNTMRITGMINVKLRQSSETKNRTLEMRCYLRVKDKKTKVNLFLLGLLFQ